MYSNVINGIFDIVHRCKPSLIAHVILTSAASAQSHSSCSSSQQPQHELDLQLAYRNQALMSFYNIYPDITIDYAVCNTCGVEAFTWLADVFDCPVCGSGNRAYRHYTDDEINTSCTKVEIQSMMKKDYYYEVRRLFVSVDRRNGWLRKDTIVPTCGKKRKRSLSDVGGRERQ